MYTNIVILQKLNGCKFSNCELKNHLHILIVTKINDHVVLLLKRADYTIRSCTELEVLELIRNLLCKVSTGAKV